MKKLLCVGALALASIGASLDAQVTEVQPLGYIPASQPANGLGFNTAGNSWEFPMMAAIGAKYIRYDCPWGNVEIRNADNTSGGYTLPTSCSNVMNLSKQYGMTPQINALFGPPYGTVATVNPTSAVTTTGNHTIAVTVATGNSLSSLATKCFDSNSKPLCEIVRTTAPVQITGAYDYTGSLITAIDPVGGTITLAYFNTQTLATTDVLNINQLMYAPIIISGSYNASNPTDPSVMAYVNYAHFLATSEKAVGLTYGEVGLWNEPVWPGGVWPSGYFFWDNDINSPFGKDHDNSGSSLPLFTAMQPIVPGVRYVNNWTNKSSSTSLMSYYSLNYTTAQQLQANIAAEAIHPYGDWPEKALWSAGCVRALAKTTTNPAGDFDSCLLHGAVHGQNAGAQVMYASMPLMGGGIPLEINETGFAFGTNWTKVAKFDTRQFLGFQAAGVTPIIFFRFSGWNANGTPPTYDWANLTTHAPLPIYNVFLPMMQDIQSIAKPPIGPISQCSSPYVSSYNGTYILDTVTLQGLQNSTDQMNSILFYSWQQSNGNGTADSWGTFADPAAAPVSVVIPAGYSVSKIYDVVGQTNLTYTQTGNTLTYNVSDGPIELFLAPTNTNTNISACAAPLS